MVRFCQQLTCRFSGAGHAWASPRWPAGPWRRFFCCRCSSPFPAAGAQPTFPASTANLYPPVRQPTSTTSVLQDSIQQDPIQKAPSTDVRLSVDGAFAMVLFCQQLTCCFSGVGPAWLLSVGWLGLGGGFSAGCAVTLSLSACQPAFPAGSATHFPHLRFLQDPIRKAPSTDACSSIDGAFAMVLFCQQLTCCFSGAGPAWASPRRLAGP